MTRMKRMPFSLLLCVAALAGCGGGGAGGPAGPSPPGHAYTSYGSYGNWYRNIGAKLAAMADCTDSCSIDIAAFDFANYRSPFGANAAFDGNNDQWEAEWRGSVRGIRTNDPDSGGPDTPRWDGIAVLRIESPNWSRVLFWTEDTKYRLANGERGANAPDKLPYSVGQAWPAVLSTLQGQKGHFSYVSGGTIELFGQFSAAQDGVTPSSAIGHFQVTGHTAIFNVSN